MKHPRQQKDNPKRKGASPSRRQDKRRDAADRLLAALTFEGAEAWREEENVRVTRISKGVRVEVGRFPLAALTPLLEAGAATCTTRGAHHVVRITSAGRARLTRLAASAGEAFCAQHREMDTITRRAVDGEKTLHINRRADPLYLLRRYRGRDGAVLCGEGAFAAAERFSRDMILAQAIPQVTANWSRLVVDGVAPRHGLAMPERALAARARLEAALHAIGPDFANILLDVCGFSKGLERLEQERGWPMRSGKIIVSLALKALARHYGLDDAAQGRDHTPMKAWLAPDARPDMIKPA